MILPFAVALSPIIDDPLAGIGITDRKDIPGCKSTAEILCKPRGRMSILVQTGVSVQSRKLGLEDG